jgi:hypothetical protein
MQGMCQPLLFHQVAQPKQMHCQIWNCACLLGLMAQPQQQPTFWHQILLRPTCHSTCQSSSALYQEIDIGLELTKF